MLDDEAGEYYEHEVSHTARSYQQTKETMYIRFDSDATQRRVLHYLQNLTISKFLDGNVSINDALTKITAETQSKFLRIPKKFQSDHFKVNF